MVLFGVDMIPDGIDQQSLSAYLLYPIGKCLGLLEKLSRREDEELFSGGSGLAEVDCREFVMALKLQTSKNYKENGWQPLLNPRRQGEGIKTSEHRSFLPPLCEWRWSERNT
ncbi:unnamed protein product [Nezara viridula]|uniref:Uncharacterized protein n=1 Tax=Nezara viridula TaxID=85310 RepID=A0A9P0HNA3_NEZVI|nr:unnamed protein product [Nezara viridula]